MNSDKFDALLSTLPNLQNLDFHLTKVPNDKINSIIPIHQMGR